MNPLEQYRLDKADGYALPYSEGEVNGNDIESSFKAGFDSAIELKLPIKYARWKDSIFKGFVSSVRQPEQWKKIEEIFNKVGKSFTEEQLYEYWINNIFKPE